MRSIVALHGQSYVAIWAIRDETSEVSGVRGRWLFAAGFADDEEHFVADGRGQLDAAYRQ